MNALAIPRSYAELRRAVENVVVAGRRGIEEAWVRTYHETGRLIAEHLLLHADRADYGARVMSRLAEESKISRRTLHECVQFYRCYPNLRPGAQLSWAQYRLLCQVADPGRRVALAAELEKRGATKVELETRVRALNAAGAAESDGAPASGSRPRIRLLKPRRGSAGLFRIVARDAGLAVDIGFKLYRPLNASGQRGLAAGGIARFADGFFEAEADATAADLFTYRATIRRVIDGDTLAVTLALPDCEMDEKLRLRGLDCPEMDTPEGKAAKRYVETLLVDAAAVVIATSKVDKYDRYLADVHVWRPSGEEIFLNNALLAHGHAVPMGAEAMTDWTP